MAALARFGPLVVSATVTGAGPPRAIVDGRIVGEGEVFGPGLRVESIDASSVAFQYGLSSFEHELEIE
jgi:hypothetical protein